MGLGMTARLSLALAIVVSATFIVHARHARAGGDAAALDALPMTIDTWHGRDAAPVDEETKTLLGADAYLTRSYSSGTSAPVGVYAAYYAQQRPGVSIHSPLHCLPGTGWEPLDVGTRTVEAGGTSFDVRRMVIRKERERAVVIYWYAVHGRTIANELASKLWLLTDSVRSGRSDAALIRVSVPVTDSVDSAERDALAFTRRLVPLVSRLWS